jgi:transcriptional regulator with PAS, ATPase and Fis domain
MSIDTASMQLFGSPASPDGAKKGGTSAGLVLLYAPGFDKMRPAYLLTSSEVTIGRDAEQSGIVVPEQAVSRQHARISYRDGRWLLRDLGSRNGTLVDGAFVDEVELEHLHEIRIGDAIFKFVAAGAEGYAPYRLDGAMIGGAARRSTRFAELVGGYQMDKIASDLEKIAPTDLSVIVLGESGTGKEVVAREMHRASGRRGAMQAINCAAIPATLLESELFGYKRGAFSGADRDKPGIIRAADGGTLFLDEIGDMPLEAQAKLLRVLETREVFPVGATQGEHVDVRVVCATHRDLGKMQREGKFRGDLFARLDDYRVLLPPLRERKEDVYLLTRHMLARHGRPDLAMSFRFVTALLHYDFPFNVRELEATIKRAIALSDGRELDVPQLSDAIREQMEAYGKRATDAPARTSDLPPAMGATEGVAHASTRRAPPSEDELRGLLSRHRGNVAAVGRELGKERMQVHRWMKRYGIAADDYRE